MSSSTSLVEDVFNTDWTYQVNEVQKVVTNNEVSEKSLVMDSLKTFADEKINESQSNSFEENGAIVSKPSEPVAVGHSSSISNLEELKKAYSGVVSSDIIDRKLRDKSNISLMFISDEYNLEGEYESEFDILFNGPTSELFSKMVKAMQLDPSSYMLSAVKSSEDAYQSLIDEINVFKPRLIICLGITPSKSLLKINKRLKEIHGKFLEMNVNSENYKVMPLFSPHLLGSAPNMKKIAWEDMQKAMSFLSK
ncbi:MAG: hypothetical protein N4A33_11000 [Bacteriovoracaceae bacterium]|nr:hypothetical protein [Bacteriovoracaceae bacterium]